MKKYIIPAVVVVAFGIYVLLSSQKSVTVATPPVTTNNGTSDPSGAGSSTPSTTTTTGGTTPTPAATTGMYKDGTYQGSVADAYFGNLQVQAVIQGGKLVDCTPLQYPQDNGHSLEVSNQSLPILKQEAIQAQSAQVNIVSGATQTSQAFQESLGAALALAKN